MNTAYFLYAEDDEEEIDILQDVISQHKRNCKLLSVQNGFEVLKFLQGIGKNESYPCLILLDKKMPKLDGIETLRFLKSDDLYRLIPVALFTSSLSASEQQLCNQLGAETLIKPQIFSNWNPVIEKMYSYIDM